MTAAELLSRAEKGRLPAVVLLLGAEAFERRRIREALHAGLSDDAIARHDLSEVSLSEVLDDARALSLFASERLIWVVNAESALPRGRAAEEAGEGESGGSGDAAPLAEYIASPTPGVTVVFEASRFEFEGDDKRKLDRVRKFYSAVKAVVELKRFDNREAREQTVNLARAAGFNMQPAALDLLVESLGADVARIAIEIEKLALYANGRVLGEDDVAALVPDARSSNIFALVSALGRRDRARSLDLLDTLTRDGEYLPLALAFLATQFRMALVAREAGLRSASQVQAHFSRMGIPMWGSRAEQVWQTVAKFNKAQIERAMRLIFETDRGLRDARPDDRIVMERFVLNLTA